MTQVFDKVIAHLLLCLCFLKGDTESLTLSGFDHAPLDVYIYSASRLALLVAWLSLQCIFLFMCLATLIPQEDLLAEGHLLDTMASSCALEISSLNPIERHKANCLSATLC